MRERAPAAPRLAAVPTPTREAVMRMPSRFVPWIATLAACLVATPAHAVLWGVKTLAPISGPPSTLFRVSSGSFSVVGEMKLGGASVDADGLALRADGVLFAFLLAIGANQSQLARVDPATAAVTLVGPVLAGRDIRGATFRSDGTLLAIDASTNELIEVDDDAGTIVGTPRPLTLSGAPFDVHTICDVAEVPGGNLTLASLNQFLALDPATGALALLHTDVAAAPDGGGVSHAGLAWDTDLVGTPRLAGYEVSGEEDLFAYDPSASYARTLPIPNIIPSYNAGRGDLAALPVAALSAPGPPAKAPAGVWLSAHPNPSRGEVSIGFSLPAESDAEISVHAITGSRVRSIAAGRFGAGSHTLRWDGRDDRGAALPAGIYLVRVDAEAGRGWRRVTLLR